jgi:hypothetical protein
MLVSLANLPYLFNFKWVWKEAITAYLKLRKIEKCPEVIAKRMSNYWD